MRSMPLIRVAVGFGLWMLAMKHLRQLLWFHQRCHRVWLVSHLCNALPVSHPFIPLTAIATRASWRARLSLAAL